MSTKGRLATIEISEKQCVGCKNCTRVCVQDVYRWDEENGHAVAKYQEDCIMCYQCEMACAGKCIEVIPSPIQYYDMLDRFDEDPRYKEHYARFKKEV